MYRFSNEPQIMYRFSDDAGVFRSTEISKPVFEARTSDFMKAISKPVFEARTSDFMKAAAVEQPETQTRHCQCFQAQHAENRCRAMQAAALWRR
jgi:hypothetical protein